MAGSEQFDPLRELRLRTRPGARAIREPGRPGGAGTVARPGTVRARADPRSAGPTLRYSPELSWFLAPSPIGSKDIPYPIPTVNNTGKNYGLSSG